MTIKTNYLFKTNETNYHSNDTKVHIFSTKNKLNRLNILRKESN